MTGGAKWMDEPPPHFSEMGGEWARKARNREGPPDFLERQGLSAGTQAVEEGVEPNRREEHEEGRDHNVEPE